jgi:CHAP domain
MRLFSFSALVLAIASPVLAIDNEKQSAAAAVQRHWECVPIARALSGIEIFGNAHTWWGQAAGRFNRGSTPKRGAVLAFKPHGSMRLGHVAAVSRVIDDRTVLVTHSNWSLINGRRGQIERNVKVIDVSSQGDWSRVRVWFAPLGDLGGTVWPVHGFIYPQGAAPMSLPANARVAGTMPNIHAKPAGAVRPIKPTKPQKFEIKAQKKAQKHFERENERDQERETEATKTSNKPAKVKMKEPKPTGRLDYLDKLFSKQR